MHFEGRESCSLSRQSVYEVQSRYKEIERRSFFGASYLKNYLDLDEMVKHKDILQG